MYSINEIRKLQLEDDFFESENDKYCLITNKKVNRELLTGSDLINQANFCVLQTIKAYKEKKIDKNRANFILNKIEALEYSKDMLGIIIVIDKLNKEIIEEELHIPYFDFLCIKCEDLYADFKQ